MTFAQSRARVGALLYTAVVLLLVGCGSFDLLDDAKSKGRRSGASADANPSPSPTASVSPSPTASPSPSPTTQPTPVPTPVVDECYKADAFICAIEKAIVEQTNEYRGSRGSLKFSKKLGFAAREWSVAMGQRGFIGHAGFPSARMADLRAEFGDSSGIGMSGENVAMTGGSGSDAEAVARAFTRMWWNSAGHRSNMLGRHQAIGVGVYRKGSGMYYATQIFGRGD